MDQVKQRTMLELVKVAKEKGDADAILEIVRYMQPLINKPELFMDQYSTK